MDRDWLGQIVQAVKQLYLWKLTRQVLKECFSWSTEQIMPVLIALISAWAALYFKLVPFDQTRAAYIAYLLPFAAALAAYMIYQIVRAPFVLHYEQEREIARLVVELAKAQPTPEGAVLVKFLNEQGQREQTYAMRELASEMRASRTHESLHDTMRAVREANIAGERSQRASKLAAFSKRGKELFEMKLTQNEHLESWKLNVEAWHRDIMATLNDSESMMIRRLPISLRPSGTLAL